MTCSPTGIPSGVQPQGIEAAGWPVRCADVFCMQKGVLKGDLTEIQQLVSTKDVMEKVFSDHTGD